MSGVYRLPPIPIPAGGWERNTSVLSSDDPANPVAVFIGNDAALDLLGFLAAASVDPPESVRALIRGLKLHLQRFDPEWFTN